MGNEKILCRRMEKTGDDLSILGYGCMRFPQTGGIIDEAKAEKQVISAIEAGVNYFDTAYIYPNSEKVLGKILAKGYRHRVKIATKLPIPTIHSRADINRIFEKSLERLQTDYIDYYLIHNVVSFEEWCNLKECGVLDFIKEEQAKKRIINVGFSAHANLQDFKKVVDDYDWSFCQIQYNYIDENYQAGAKGLEYAAEKGLGIIVMEPLRGGTLGGNLPEEALRLINSFEPKRSPAEWALRWVWNHPAVNVVLSGMNVDAHISENIQIASQAKPNSMSDSELKLLDEVKNVFHKKLKVNCTGCAYCMPCPKGVNIPLCFAMYNSKSMLGGMMPAMQYLMWTSGERKSGADVCSGCGACEKHCPQHIPIRKHLKDVSAELDKWYLRLPVKIARRIMYGGKKAKNK